MNICIVMKYVNYYFLFVQINVVYTYSYCHLTNKDININIEGLVTLILAKL